MVGFGLIMKFTDNRNIITPVLSFLGEVNSYLGAAEHSNSPTDVQVHQRRFQPQCLAQGYF